MKISDWFNYQLKASADNFVWAIEQVPAARHFTTPPMLEGAEGWTVAHHIFHLYYHERQRALPYMLHWQGEPLSELTDFASAERSAWEQSELDIEQLLMAFQKVRSEQIALLPRINDALWLETKKTAWGEITLKWVVTGTLQHTAHHSSTILNLALHWDRAAEREQQISVIGS